MGARKQIYLAFAVLPLLIFGEQVANTCSAEAQDGGHCSSDHDPTQISPYASYISNTEPNNKRERPMSAKFVNLLNKPVKQYWDDGTAEGKYQGGIHHGESTHGTFTTHVFFFKTKDGKEVARFTMSETDPMYIIHGDDPSILNSDAYKKYNEEREFMLKYQAEHGQPWLSVYPRDPPILPIWPPVELGHRRRILSNFGHWKGDENYEPSFSTDLLTVSLKPKVFLIEGLLSEEECDHIIEMGKSRIKRSIIGLQEEAYADDTRTSRTGWIGRTESKRINHMFKRFADVLGVKDEQLKHSQCAEPLQVVHYGKNQHYYNHFDFFNTGSANKNYRFLTLLFYLNNATSTEAGGHTGFPKAFGGKGLKVRPPRGSAVLFYSMMEDGNCDDFSEHTGMHVLDGEKWVANLWVWDPKR